MHRLLGRKGKAMAEPKVSRWGAGKSPPAPEIAKPEAKAEAPKPAGFQEFPKVLYRGGLALVVNSAEEEEKARADGFGAYVPPVA